MNAPLKPASGLEGQRATPLLDVLIRAGLIFALATLCYRIFSPFLTLTVWAVILAVTMYPLHQRVAYRLGGQAGMGVHADRPGWCGALGGADGPAGGFAGRRGA